MRLFAVLVLAAVQVCSLPLAAQTQVHLSTQGRGVDFSQQSATRPVKTGSSLPAACAPGELFFLTSAPAGRNLYGCAVTNTWSLLGDGGGGSGSGLPSQNGQQNRLLTTNGTDALWLPLGAGLLGDGSSLRADFTVVPGLGRPNAYTGNNTFFNNVQVQTPGVLDASGAAQTKPCRIANGVPAGPAGQGECTVNVVTGDFYFGTSTGTWVPAGGGSGVTPAGSVAGAVQLRSADGSALAADSGLFYSIDTLYLQKASAAASRLYIDDKTASGTNQALVVARNGTPNASVASDGAASFSAVQANSLTARSTNSDLTLSGNGTGKVSLGPVSGVRLTGGTAGQVVTTDAAGNLLFTTPVAVFSGTASLAFGTVLDGACSADQSVTVTGAALGDAVQAGWPAALPSGLFGVMRVSAANTVAVRVCNLSGAAVTLASASYAARIVK